VNRHDQSSPGPHHDPLTRARDPKEPHETCQKTMGVGTVDSVSGETPPFNCCYCCYLFDCWRLGCCMTPHPEVEAKYAEHCREDLREL